MKPGTVEHLCRILLDLPAEYPAVFQLNVREWDGEFLFNPKKVVAGQDRVVLELSNGHCVNKSVRMFRDRLVLGGGELELDIRVKDGDRSVFFKAPGLHAEFAEDEMMVKIMRAG